MIRARCKTQPPGASRAPSGSAYLSVTQVETALYNSYGTRQISQIYAPNNQYQVILQVAPEFQRDPSALSLLYVRSNAGRLVPLDTVVRRGIDAGRLLRRQFADRRRTHQ